MTRDLEARVEASLFPEFVRTSQITELKYDTDKLSSTKVVVVGTNQTAEQLVKQMLAIGFREIYLWGPDREGGDSKARLILRKLNHISPYYRSKAGYESLEARAISSSFDEVGFSRFDALRPKILINTQNNSYLSDVLMERFFQEDEEGLFIDSNTVSDHDQKMYGLMIQTARRIPGLPSNTYDLIESSRDLSAFEGKKHDSLMAVIAASYTAALATRYVLNGESSVFISPTKFTLFPFAQNPLLQGPAKKEVHYEDFFADRNILLAGLGGGSLVFEVLADVFKVRNLVGIDNDRLERHNMNRLIPLIDESLIGLKKTEALRRTYSDYVRSVGRSIRFVDGTIYDTLVVDNPESFDLIFGCLSGFDNKFNLIVQSQNLARPPLLLDIGNEPFRVDITPYLSGKTPCDHCRNVKDLAITEYFEGNIPGCDKYPTGSTVFSNYLGVLAIVEAMKHFDPSLGRMVSGSLTLNLLPPVHSPGLYYEVKQAGSADFSACADHQSRSPLLLRPDDFQFRFGMETGWHVVDVLELLTQRHVGRFRYVPSEIRR